MRVHYLSDLHLERSDVAQRLPEGAVLAVAGDVFEARLFDPAIVARARNPEHWAERRREAERFFEEAAARFDRVFYVAGNHEYYGASIAATHEILARRLPQGVTWLEGEVVEHEGVWFVGGALWSDFLGGDAGAMATAARSLSDFRMIRADGDGEANPGEANPKARFTPADARARFALTRQAIEDALADETGPPVVAITHHCPSPRCWGGSRLSLARLMPLRHAFYTDLEPFIRVQTRLRAWICGHTHRRDRFTVGETEIAMNPRGYFLGEDHPRTERISRSFSTDLSLDIAL